MGVFKTDVGNFPIEGDFPNDAEMQAILEVLNKPDPPPPTPTSQGPGRSAPTPEPRATTGPGPEGPLGIMPKEARGALREKVEEMPGLVQLMTEMGLSVGGGIKGASIAARLPLPPQLKGPAIVGGGIIGSLVGEVASQETGLAPKSDLNLALSATGPLGGAAVAKVVQKVGGRLPAKLFTGLPFVNTAVARASLKKGVEDIVSKGVSIIEKQRGLLARPTGDLFRVLRKSNVRFSPEMLKSTSGAMDELLVQMRKLGDFPEINAAIKTVERLKGTLSVGGPTGTITRPGGVTSAFSEGPLIADFIEARSLIGKAVGIAEAKGGTKLFSTKKLFAALSDDLDRMAASLTGRDGRLAKAAVARAKLQFSIETFEEGVGKFITDVGTDANINIQGMEKWLLAITNPKGKQFDKNFTAALVDELPAIKARLAELVKVASKAGVGGTLVVRSAFARVGRTVVGGTIGAITGGIVGGGVGAGIGGVLGATMPERIVAALATESGAKFLLAAVKFGKGTISTRVWAALGQIVARASGEGDEQGARAAGRPGTRGGERGRGTAAEQF